MMRIEARSAMIDAYGLLFFHPGTFFRLAGGWLACLLGCVLAGMVDWPQPIALLLLLITIACLAAFSAGFSVHWSRAMLEEEPEGDIVPLTLGRRDIRFLGYQSAFALLVGIPLLMLAMLLHADSWWAAALAIFHGGKIELAPILALFGDFVLAVPMAIGALIIVPRLMIVLPAVATDVPGPLLADVWRYSRDNTTRLLYGWLACVLPPLGVWALLAFQLTAALGNLAMPLVELIAYICWFVALALSSGFLCHVYVQIAGGISSDSDKESSALGAPLAAK